MRDIGKNIKALRIQKNMTQDELAEKLFVTRQTISNYETGRSRPDVEMLSKIAEVLETDINTVVYGRDNRKEATQVHRILAGCTLVALLLLLRKLLEPYASVLRANFQLWMETLVYCLLDPLIWLCTGWILTQLILMALRKVPLKGQYVPYLRRGIALLLVLWFLILVPYLIAFSLDSYLYSEKIRGQWVDDPYEANGLTVIGKRWQRIPLPVLEYLEPLGVPVMQQTFLHRQFFFIPGILLCLCGFPVQREQKKTTDNA